MPDRQTFADRHIGPDPDETGKALSAVGYRSLEALAADAVPATIRLRDELDLPAAASEPEVSAELRALAARNHRLVQMITNLLSNAARYGEPPVLVEVRPGDTTVEIRVCDHGAGVSDVLAPRLFRKFVRGTGKADRGTGLGLFIVAEMARRQGGEVWYERADGRSCFAFHLPAGRSAQE